MNVESGGGEDSTDSSRALLLTGAGRLLGGVLLLGSLTLVWAAVSFRRAKL